MRRAFVISAVCATLGVVGALVGIIIDSSAKAPPALTPVNADKNEPIAGSGLVEPTTGTIAVAPPVAGVVRRVLSSWGQQVHRGDPLFELDDRDLQAARQTAKAEVDQAAAAIEPAQQQLQATHDLLTRQLATKQDVAARVGALETARAALAVARARLDAVDVDLDRRTVRAPIDGQILKINVRPGEFTDPAAANSVNGPAILMGTTAKLVVRAEFDESNVWRFSPDMPAQASLPGNPQMTVHLRFERIEPYVLPKTHLSGNPTERADTRVLQVIYSLAPAAVPIYIGQRLDVVATPTASASSP